MTPGSTISPVAPTLHSALGVHILLECSGCLPPLLSDAARLKSTLTTAAKEAGATVVDSLIHQFNPHGLSGVIVIAESHIAVHTWPERGYAAIDIFTCGMPEIAEKIRVNIIHAFQPDQHTSTHIDRCPPSG